MAYEDRAASPARLDGAQWERLSRLLDEALELPPAARRAWLDGLPRAQDDLRASLENVLFGDRGIETLDFLARAAHADAPSGPHSLAVGEEVGPYRLIRELGSGGTASVWLAERTDGVLQRKVALKLPHLGLVDRGLAERLARERNILGGLEHPNIARLYDAGVDGKGRPFLALEYVDGVTPVEYCSGRAAPTRQRLSLFLEIAKAVAYAHARLVVHRDLKPSNILVTDNGDVRLLDFGIARLLHGDRHDKLDLTRVGMRALTPAYAAPEQFTGGDITVATDIYSLGVILFELLTGRSPYSPRRKSLSAIEDSVVLEEAPLASRVAAPAEARALRGDLDTILSRALQKAPAERYASVESFARDIERHLAGLPIAARPPSFWYTTGKFIRRNALPVSIVSVLGAGILAALGVALWQWQLATHERALAIDRVMRAQAISEFATSVLVDGIKKGDTLNIDQLLARSEQMAAEAGETDATMRAVSANFIANWYMRYDLAAKATDALTRAIDSLPPEARGLRAELACNRARARQAIGGDVTALSDELKRELAGIGDDPTTKAACLRVLGFLAGLSGDARARLDYTLAALDEYEKIPGQSLTSRARTLADLGMAYARAGQPDRGVATYAQVIELFERAGMATNGAMATAHTNFAVIWQLAGNPLQALREADAAAEIEQRHNPGGVLSDVAMGNRGLYLERLGRYSEAAEFFGKAHDAAVAKGNVSSAVAADAGLALMAMERGDLDAAEKWLKEAADSSAHGKPASSVRIDWANARLARARGRAGEARTMLDMLIAESAKSGSDPGRRVIALAARSETWLADGNFAAAARDADAALELARQVQGNLPHAQFTGEALLALGKVRAAQHRRADAVSEFERAIPHLVATLGEAHPDVTEARRLLVEARAPG